MMRQLLLPICLLACSLPAGAADAPPSCIYTELGRLPIRLVGPWLAPAVEGTIDGTPATMLVDTGDFATHLTMTGALKRNMPLRTTKRQVEGFGGSSRVYATRVQDFSIGPIRSSGGATMDIIHSALLTDYDAMVGASFLLQADLEVDLRAKRLRFLKPQNCGATPLYLWDEETVVVPFGPGDPDDLSPNPHFTVTINGKEIDAAIDTGAPNTMLALGAARRVGIDLDGPDVKRAGHIGGIGSGLARYWTAKVKSFAIGGETIHDAELGIRESRGLGTDLLLGRDFLRTHRVLFAMSQQKLYIAYLGGQPFSPNQAMEPWMREEAEAGNPDAQYALALRYWSGTGVARDEAQGRAWMDKAAANGQPHALLESGADLVRAGKLAEAIAILRKGLDRLPTDRHGALWLYLARVHNGEAALAKTELRTSQQKLDNDMWPGPIARFYLGEIDAARLLDSAGEVKDLAKERSCEARRFMARWHAAQGDGKQAEPLLSEVARQCDKS
jgi:predicted aspartyl protease